MGRFNRGASTNILHIFSDGFFGLLAFTIAILVAGISISKTFSEYLPMALAFLFIFMLSNKEARLYNVTTFFYADRVILYVSRSFVMATGVTALLIFYIGHASIQTKFYTIYLTLTYCFMLISAYMIHYINKHYKKNAPRVLLAGNIDKFGKFRSYMSKNNMDINVIGYVNMDEDPDNRYLGNIDELENLILENAIAEVYIMHRKGDLVDIQQYIDICMDMGVTVRIVVDIFKAKQAQSYVSSIGTYPTITYHRVSLNGSSKVAKRIMDLVGSLVGIILFSPIMIVTAVAIKLDSKGPVIFKQKRVGLNGKHFMMYKFRSMVVNAEELKEKLRDQNEVDDGLMFKIKNDPRVTKVGHFIRKTSIDELPQFFNVLFGDMSLVGTRPPTLDEVEKYERSHWRRMSIKPGITGMWQVSGRSEIKDFDEIVELDTIYIDQWSIFSDFKVILKTVLVLLRRKGAY